MTGLILGAYTAAPSGLADNDAAWSTWYARLREEPLVGGLEIAWDRDLVPGGARRLAMVLEPRWRSVVTMMAGVSARMGDDPRYGLASEHEEARQLAVADVMAAHREIAAIRTEVGPEAVVAIELQSAPTATVAAASATAFTTSLREILELDWAGVEVVIEHCDGADGVLPQKAFLPLEVEVACLEDVSSQVGSTRTGHAVNWARSVIERRSSNGAEDSIAHLVQRGSLTGLMFSGVSPVATVFGSGWRDSHLPVADCGPGSEPTSLLTTARVASGLARAGDNLHYVGAKISAPKTSGLSLDERLAPGIATLRAIAEAAIR